MLALYAPAASPANVAAEASRMAELASRNGNATVWTECFAAMDITSLDSADSDRSITEFAGKAARLAIDFPHLPPPASLCVWPSFVDVAGLALGGSRIAITSVAGGFPSSQTFIEVKMLEAAMAVESGADEIDVVISIGDMLDGEYDRMAGILALLREEVGDQTILKVIIETGALRTPRLIRDASLLAMMAGADFVKTSTGKFPVPAADPSSGVQPLTTPQAAVVICTAIRDYHERTGRQVGFKVAGGVRTPADAVLYHTIVGETLGREWLSPALFRIGASSLANNLLSAIEGREIRYF